MDSPKYTKEELDKKTIKDLKALCNELSIPNHSKLKKINKDEYINAILNKNTLKTTVKETSLKKNESSIKKKRKTNKLIYENKDENVKIEKNDIFKKFVDKQHNLLRGSAVTGLDAYDDILYGLLLCYIEDKINKNELDINNCELECYVELRKPEDYVKFLKVDYLISKSDELILQDGTNSSIIKLSKLFTKHPETCKIFVKEGTFINCKDTSILKELLYNCKIFYNANLTLFKSSDILGIGYEHMTTRYNKGSGSSADMGQYFTERLLMAMCFAIIDKEDIDELINNDSIIGDEFCGTFGFPLYLKAYLKKEHNIDIENKNIYGVEYHDTLSKYALMNSHMSLNTYDNIICGDSFVTNVSPHLDFSVHNVPFGKSMEPTKIKEKYTKYYNENEDKNLPTLEEYLPFCNKKIDAILSSQVALYKTKKMGLMIIKDGEETSGKSNSDYRKWFCEKCIIKKIMKIPSGAFSSTGTKTVCIYFIKKEGKQTENIQFLQLSDDGTKINEICNVSIEELKQNNYSWEPNSYILDETIEKMMEKSTCEWKKLNNCIVPIIGNLKNSKLGVKKTTHNKYPLYYCSILGYLYLNTFDYDETGIIINKTNGSGKCMVYLGKGKYNVGNTTLHFKTICQINILTEFIYYFLILNLNILEKHYKGSNQKSISYNDFENINIPIPFIEKQKECVKILDDLTTQKQLLNDRKSGIKRQMKYYLETQIKINKEFVKIQKLGEICEIKNGTSITKDKLKTGNIQVVGGGVKPLGFHNIHNLEKNTILISKDGANAGFVSIYDNPIFATGHALFINNIHLNVKKFYLYYILKHFESQLYNFQKGGGQPGVNKDEIKDNLNIPILPIEKQKEIVQYLDKLEKEKNEIIEKINKIDKLMKDVLELSYN